MEYVLGLKIRNRYLSVEPCIDKNWKEFEINYKYKTSIYHICVKNPKGKNSGVEKFIVGDIEVSEKRIFLQDDCKIYNIEIIM